MAQSTTEFYRLVKIQHRAESLQKKGLLKLNYVYTKMLFIQCFNQDQTSCLKVCERTVRSPVIFRSLSTYISK